MSPRKHRSARERPGPPPPRQAPSAAPLWAVVPGVEVRTVAGDKEYRCPGCQQLIPRGTPHLVVVPADDPASRRHWHTPCWRREVRRRG